MKLAIIAAVARNRTIGKGGQLPWHISDDLKRFKRLTTGHAVLMGRKTYQSIGRPLPNRRNVVLSSTPIVGVETYSSIAESFRALAQEETVFVIGGGAVFTQLLPQADELYLTLVHQDADGDTMFPPYEHLLNTRFALSHREDHDGYSFVDYQKIDVTS